MPCKIVHLESVPNGFDPGWIIFNTQVDIMIIHKVVNALDLEPLRRFGYYSKLTFNVQDDHSCCAKHPVDYKTKVAF